MNESGEFDRKVFLDPEDFPRLISPEQLEVVNDYQEHAFAYGHFENYPFPPTENPELLDAYTQFSENREIYVDDDAIESAIDSDEILERLRPTDPTKLTPEKARLIRIRSSVVAAQHVLFKNYVTLELHESKPSTDHYRPQVA